MITKTKPFDVYLTGMLITTVYYNCNSNEDMGEVTTAEDVKRDLVEHDGYPANIQVFARKERK
jgi:hypothetical protein